MKKTLLEIYALLICFGAVVCFSIWTGIGAYSLVGTFNPELTVNSWVYERHQTNDRFWKGNRDLANPFLAKEKTATKPPERPSEESLTKKRIESYQQELHIEARNNKQTLLQTAIVIIICMLLFFAHWRLAKSVRFKDTSN